MVLCLMFKPLSHFIYVYGGLPRWLSGKNLSDNSGDKRNVGSIPGLGKYSGGANGHPLCYSCL